MARATGKVRKPEGREYLLEDPADLPALMERIGAWKRLEKDGDVVLHRLFRDTFDWRLTRAHALLETESRDGSWGAILRLADGSVLRARGGDPFPRFMWELSPGRVAASLKPLIEMRALLLVAEVKTLRHGFHAVNKERKKTLNLLVEDNRLLDGRKGVRLGCRVLLEPVRGYPKAFRKGRKILEDEFGLSPADNVLQEILAARGITPDAPTAKPRTHLTPSMPAWLAVRKALLPLVSVVERNEDGVREDLDTEFLHDFRVAVRSTRAIMTQMNNVFPRNSFERFRAGFAWLGNVTGPVRDLDVYLLGFQKFRRMLPVASRSHLDPLKGYLEAKRQGEHNELARALGSQKYKRLVRDWRRFLQTDGDLDRLPAAAVRPVSEAVNGKIRKLYRRALQEGGAIDEASPPEALHELRKTCKKLRYMLEFFESLYPAGKLSKLILDLKGLQQCLGDYQDSQVQAEAVSRFQDEIAAVGPIPAETRTAMEVLVKRLARRQRKARAVLADRFAHFVRPRNRKISRELFRSEPRESARKPRSA